MLALSLWVTELGSLLSSGCLFVFFNSFIISFVHSSARRIKKTSAEYIDNFLAPLAKQHKSYLKKTNDFVTKIAGIKAREGAFIATIDVASLHTNIDNTNGLEAVKQIFIKNPDPKRLDKDILELLKIN